MVTTGVIKVLVGMEWELPAGKGAHDTGFTCIVLRCGREVVFPFLLTSQYNTGTWTE